MAYDETYRRPGEQGDDASPYRSNGLSTADYRGRRREPEPADVGGRYLESSAGSVGYAGRGPRDTRADRLGVHVGWEIVLLLAVAAIGYLLYRFDPASLRRPALDTLLISGTVIGLLTLGAGLTLRAGVPNLAVGPIALAAALQYAEQGDRGLLQSGGPALGIAAAGGLVVAVLVLGLNVPAWAASLASAMGVVVFCQLRTAPVTVQGDYDPSNQAFFLFGGFALLAVIGGAVGSMVPMRRMLGQMRPEGDAAERRGFSAALPVAGSLVLSSVFAATAGILMAAQSTQPIVPATGFEWTGIAFGTALLAGTSVFGRRGGIFGTLLAVTGLALFLDYSDRRNFDIALFAIAGCVIAAGLVVSRLIETYGRPYPPLVAEEWTGGPAETTGNWSPANPESWSSGVPGQARSDRWDAGPWGGTR